MRSELKTVKLDILNPDRLINLEINYKRRKAIFNLEIKKKRRSSIDLDIHHSKVFSPGQIVKFSLSNTTTHIGDFYQMFERILHLFHDTIMK